VTPVGFAPLADVPLAPRTTLGVGGRARWLVEAKAEVEVIEALAWAGERSLSVLVLGGGSNLLVADRGFDGLVLCPRLRGVDARLEQASAVLDAGAGEPWDELVAHSVARGWAGVECLSGIPGDVGATPIQNVGAYGQEVSDTLTRVRAVERATGRAVDLDAAACGFGYRDSIFKREAKDRYVVTSVRFALRLGGAPTVRYGELSKELERRFGPREASLAEVRETVIALRRGKAMVLDPDGENGKSAGSFFMNPTVPAATAASVREKALAAGVLAADEAMPEFAGPGGLVKLSAGWLIERAGLRRGTSDGRVGLSTKHALAIVNKGGATAAEILAFARRVRGTVLDRFGVALVPEPVLIGFQPGELDGLV
jgi:UDP-N-acetylmuramate dehydrogenase